MKTPRWLPGRRNLQLGLAFLLVVGMVLAGWQRLEARTSFEYLRPADAAPMNGPSGPSGQTASAPAAPASTAVFTGDIRARDKITIASKTPARVKLIRGDVGDVVKKGDLVVELDHALLDSQVQQGEAALSLAEAQLSKLLSGSRKEQIAIAQAGVASAEAELALIMEGSRKEQIAAAQSGLKAAQAQLDLVLAGPSTEALEIAELQARIAETGDILRVKTQEATVNTRAVQTGMTPYSTEMTLYQDMVSGLQVQLAQAQLRATKAPPRIQQVQQLEAAVEAAKAQVDLLSAPPRTPSVQKQQAAVEIARQQLELARNPNTDNDMAAAAALVLQARAALDQIRTNRDDASLTAPFDGVISARISSPGALVMGGDAIVTLISNDIELVFTVGEADYSQIKRGQSLSITTAAYPGQTFSGSIRAVAPQADPVTRRFNVYVNPDDPDSKLKPGMFINVSL